MSCVNNKWFYLKNIFQRISKKGFTLPNVNELFYKMAPILQNGTSKLKHTILGSKEGIGPEGSELSKWVEKLMADMQGSIERHLSGVFS